VVIDYYGDAHTMIVNEHRVDIEEKLARYMHSQDPDIRRLCIEKSSFINLCIQRNFYRNTMSVVKAMGGRGGRVQ
jgi:hypothetical protein